jgi:anti-sigma regulatory factor (Ser/Thr protein kinase)
MQAAQQRFVIDDASKVGEARRAAQALASIDFTPELAGKVAIAATELATNIWRHAQGGELLVQILGNGETLELLAIDKGPGMGDIARCMEDGFSTRGTPGTGLGAVRRLATEFDIHSQPGEGTLVMARFGMPASLRLGAVCIPLEGEMECGDAWHCVCGEQGAALMVVDGLGHGPFAAEAARVAINSFLLSPFASPQDILTRAHPLMSRTRGGSVASALADGTRLSYCGVGNISGALLGAGRSQGLVSHNGTLGLAQRRIQQFEYHREPGSLLVMHSDGISTRWDLKNRPDLLARHPALMAAAMYRDHSRGRDDATVVVAAL